MSKEFPTPENAPENQENIESKIARLLEELQPYPFHEYPSAIQEEWYGIEMEGEVGLDREQARERLEKFIEKLKQPEVFKKGTFPERTIEKNESRPPITPELREKMDREIAAFGKLMEGSGIWWQLDGALTISIRNIAKGGDYIGMHKDIDFSVLSSDLTKLRNHIESQGYGLRYYKRDPKKDEMYFWRVPLGEVKPKWDGKLRVVKIDEKTREIDTKADTVIAGPIIYRRGEQGEFLGWRGMTFPQKWLEGETVEVKGVKIPLSHPARFVFNKLFSMKKKEPYHKEDLKRFVLDMKGVSSEDMEDIGDMLDQYEKKLHEEKEDHRRIVKEVAGKFMPGMTEDAMYEILKESITPDYLKRTYGGIVEDDPEGIDEEEIRSVARRIAEAPFQGTIFLGKLKLFWEMRNLEKKLKEIRRVFESLKERRAALG